MRPAPAIRGRVTLWRVQGNTNLPQGKLDVHFGEGVLFVTYSLLISGSAKGGSSKVKVEGAAPDVELRKGTRIHQIVQWLQNGDGDPLIVRPPLREASRDVQHHIAV